MNFRALLDPLLLTWLLGALGMLWMFIRFLMDDIDLEVESSSSTPDAPEPPAPAVQPSADPRMPPLRPRRAA